MKKYYYLDIHTLYHNKAESQRNLSVFGGDHKVMYVFRDFIHIQALFGFLELNEIDFSQLGNLGQQYLNFLQKFPFIR